MSNRMIIALVALAIAAFLVTQTLYTVDPTTHSATQYQAGAASFGLGTKVSVSVTSVGSAEGNYVSYITTPLRQFVCTVARPSRWAVNAL